jgi:adenylate cyclase
VLFADMSGFTTISERLDAEDVGRLQTDLFGALRGVIDRFDAYPEKYIGDAVVAVFGAPVAHEDDPQRALRAALEMHACAAELSERWRDQLGAPLTLHIGINTTGEDGESSSRVRRSRPAAEVSRRTQAPRVDSAL